MSTYCCIVKLRKGSGKDRQVMAKGERPFFIRVNIWNSHSFIQHISHSWIHRNDTFSIMVVTSILIRYCRSMRVDREIAGRLGRRGLKVVFTSDKKKVGGGAQCTAQCIDPAPTTTPGTEFMKKFDLLILIQFH